MFLRNRTSYKAVLARAHLEEGQAVGSVNLEVSFRIHAGELAPLAPPPARKETDPPDITRYPCWQEVSVTAAGTVYGPGRAPHVQPVSIRVGSELRRLIVFGERLWRRDLSGELTATAPEPFDAVPLAWSRAFGGSFDMAPGVVPGTDMPHPGGRFAYPLNPGGMGLYPDASAARDRPLPQIERPDQLVKRVSDRPEPGGFAPCPNLVALRFPKHEPAQMNPLSAPSPDILAGEAHAMRKKMLHHAWRVIHHAAGDLILQSVAPGCSVEVAGIGKETLRFQVPHPPVDVRTRSRRSVEPAEGRVFCLHVDADDAIVRIVYGYPFRYAPQRSPEWVEVASRK